MSSARPVRFLLPAVAALALAGCFGGEDEGSAQQERMAAPPGAAVSARSWLDPRDPTLPEVWLASRAQGRDVPASDPAVARWHDVLEDADARFDETGRMIANRAVQLEAMLEEIGVKTSAEHIIRGFAPLAAPGSRRAFGALCQHYYNLRAAGESETAALATLRGPGAPEKTP